MSLIQWMEFKVLGDDRGQLASLESGRNIPFGLQRVYYVLGTKPDVPRGFHAHRQLEQLAICLAGRCQMILDDGKSRESVWLDSPWRGVRLPPMIWHEMHEFTQDCILLVLANACYDESDYIRDYATFLKEIDHVGDTSSC